MMKCVCIVMGFILLTSCAVGQQSEADKESPVLLISGPELISLHFKRGHPKAGEPLVSALGDEFSKGALDRDLSILKRYGDLRFEILGFTDSEECSGSDCDELSLLRAMAVYDWLVKNGVSRSSLSDVAGRGASLPIDDNGTDDGRSVNRRVEINIVP